MTITMSLSAFTRFVTLLQPATEKAVVRGLKAGGLVLVKEVTRQIGLQGLVDTGELRNSVSYHPAFDGCTVTVDAPHAVALEYGARPFSAPLEPILAWVLRKGIASDEKEATRIAWGIIGKFKKQGTRPHSFFRNGFHAALPGIDAAIAKELAKIGWQPNVSARSAIE